LGFARVDGEIREADCIVILPGLFGDNGVLRTRDLALAFRDQGFHVLALELRACGQTERRYPNAFTCWGVRESADLLDVAEWLEDKPHVRRTGLVGFCWGANIALLTAWADSRSLDDPASLLR
jgi:dienelactone hydrolase